MKQLSVLIVLCLMAFDAFGCTFLPREATAHPADLVYGANAVVLAEAVSYADKEGDYATFTFDVAEVLYGRSDDTIDLRGYVRRQRLGDAEDYDAHRAPEFWAYSLGNSQSNTMCGVHGIFEVGEQYLLILGTPHLKAFENIRTEEDLWLQVIRRIVSDVS